MLPVLTRRHLGAALLSASLLLSGAAFAAGSPDRPFDTTLEGAQAPFGDQVGPALKNYLRATPFVGTAGALGEGAMAEAKALGFRTIVNLNGPDEGAAEEGQAAEAAGLVYRNIPVTEKAPGEDQVATFAALVEDPANYPILVHCQSANRVGALWALYRASRGVPGEIAVQEGRTVGMKQSREAAVRERLGLPAVE